MAGFVSYDVDQDNRFKRYIASVIKSVDDLSFSMGESARIIKKGSTANFILQGFGKYPPLSESYALRKNILAPGTPILTGAKKGSVKGGTRVSGGGASGKLKNSIVGNTGDSITLISKLNAVVGTKARSKDGEPYPIFVQEGTQKMSARKFLFFTKKMVNQIINTIDAEIAGKWSNPNG